MSLLEVEVTACRSAGEVTVVELRPANGAALPGFTAGAHLDLHLPGGLVRQYSLWNDPAETDRYLIAVRLLEAGRGGSRAVSRLRAGDRLRIGRPRNAFALDEAASRSILLAGGIGITPLMAMAHRLSSLGADFELHYRARPEASALVEEISLAPWAQRAQFHFEGSDAEFDMAGLIGRHAAGRHLYICGPEGFMAAARNAALAPDLGWPEEAIHTEHFSAAPAAGGAGFRVQTARDGRWFDIPEDRTILEVLVEAGFDIPSSCEQGICGTCRTGVLSGIPDHRDLCMTAKERSSNRYIAPCCSRSLTAELVLDL